jgi:hypothetical protein
MSPHEKKGVLLVRRLVTVALSLGLLLGLTGIPLLLAQDEKKDQPSKPEASKTEPSQDKDKEKDKEKEPEKAKDKEKEKEATPKPDASASTEAALPPIPPEVEAKLEAARRAVAEAIVAAQDAGLVKTTINPPPVLDILITGRANDESSLKAKTGVSPEVFGAWFAGQGTTKDVNAMKDVRIYNPSAGLQEYYDQRASVLNRHIDAVRKANPTAKKDEPAKKEEAKEAPPAAKEEKKEETPADDAKKEKPKEDKPEGEAKKDGEAPK